MSRINFLVSMLKWYLRTASHSIHLLKVLTSIAAFSLLLKSPKARPKLEQIFYKSQKLERPKRPGPGKHYWEGPLRNCSDSAFYWWMDWSFSSVALFARRICCQNVAVWCQGRPSEDRKYAATLESSILQDHLLTPGHKRERVRISWFESPDRRTLVIAASRDERRMNGVGQHAISEIGQNSQSLHCTHHRFNSLHPSHAYWCLRATFNGPNTWMIKIGF